MAATGGEEAGGGSLWIRITLDSSGRGGQGGEKKGSRGDGGKKRRVFNPGPTSMVVSWTVSHLRRGAPSQGQPKWWRAGQGAVPPR